MPNWKDMAKRLRKNQERNLGDYAKQYSSSEERRKFLEQIEDEKSKALSNKRRKRNYEPPMNEKGFDR